mgnify:FL=1
MTKAKKKPLQVYLTDEVKSFVEEQAIERDERMTTYIVNLIKKDQKRIERVKG